MSAYYNKSLVNSGVSLTIVNFLEVVISELLANFSFELSDKPVYWNLSGITYPSSSLESTKSELWLKVRPLPVNAS